MSDSKYSNYSSETDNIGEESSNKSPFLFPVIMLGSACVVGGVLLAVDAEGCLVQLMGGSTTKASSILTALGGASITAAHGHSMAMLGNARRKFQVHMPSVAAQSNIPFWNANRGYYNMVEHMPFFLFNFWLAREAGTPCLAGACCITYGVGRMLYTHHYAYGGPKKRFRGFVLSVLSSMACLGVALLKLPFAE